MVFMLEYGIYVNMAKYGIHITIPLVFKSPNYQNPKRVKSVIDLNGNGEHRAHDSWFFTTSQA